jgi:hypothetical protein
MSVTSVVESWSRRNGSYESQDGSTVRFSATTAYQVEHGFEDSEDTILLDSSLPTIRDGFPGKFGVFCIRTSRIPQGPGFSIVVAEWEGEVSASGGTAIDKLPTWTWTNSTTSEPVDTDAEGIPLCNSNGELKEGFTKEVSDFSLTVNRNFAAINTYTLSQYLDSVNSDPWGSPDSIWPPGTGALQSFTAQTVQEGVDLYYQVTARIDFRIPYLTIPERAWWYRYRNDGLNVRTGTKVTFSGGGASAQATAIAIVAAGVITGIKLTYGGRGYTSAPTVGITSDTGGTGASVTAVVAGGRVTGFSGLSGGSGYTSRLVRAMDDNNEQPEPRPVTLKLDGSRERDPAAAIFIERKKKQYTLPYAGLGLF